MFSSLNQENGNDNPHRKVIESGKKNITVKVDFDRSDDEQSPPSVGHLKTDQPPPGLVTQVIFSLIPRNVLFTFTQI